MHDRPLAHRDDGFRGWRAVSQSTVRSFGFVVFSSFFDQDLRFAQAVEDFAVQELISEPGIEGFAVSVLPWAARFDVGGLRANSLDPILNRLRNELGAIARRERSTFCRLWPPA